MFDFIANQILFYIAIILVMFIPGYFLLMAIFGKSKIVSTLERFIISFGLSIVVTDFIAFTYSRLNIPITRWSSISGAIFFSLVCLGIYKFKKNKNAPEKESSLFNFSKNQFVLVLLLLFLTVFIKSAYLSRTISPTTTDMGHHMYWAKWMAENHQLTNYEGMPDFIIGEHVIFTEIALISGAGFFSAFPQLILFIINLLGILVVFILVLRIFENKNIAILTLMFLGVLYAVSSPQEKFVSGGVIGNIMGNFLMPLAFYFYCRAFEFLKNNEGSASNMEIGLPYSKAFLSLAVFVTSGLFFTHHLTSFILIFIALLLVPLFVIVNYSDIENIFKRSWEIILSPFVIGTLALGLFYFFFVFAPTYVSGNAVDTAVGVASKNTRVGLTITNLKQTAGESRIALGFLGLLLLGMGFKRKNFGYSLLAAWTIMLFIMSVFPNWLFIDLPSTRIGNYISYPLAILSAYGFYSLFRPDSRKFLMGKIFFQKPENALPHTLFGGFFALLLTFTIAGGLSDSTSAFKTQNNSREAVQTFNASAYLASIVSKQDAVLKDHNYITADSWMKLFFMKGYKYPQSRGLFSRYESTGNRSNDLCTLIMIGSPASDESQKCFSDTGTNFLMVNHRFDSAQFQRLANFDQIYINDEIAIYHRK